MPEIVVHKTFKQQFGVHSVELGIEYSAPYVAVLRGDYELMKFHFNDYQDAQRAFVLVQSALSDIDDEGYGYEEKTIWL